jgi:D-amino-acid dehydrogenase
VESAFYMTPMAGRLRVAGTVELGSINDPANPKRFEYLERLVRRVMGLTDPVARKWLGFRPSLPPLRHALAATQRGLIQRYW